MTCFNKVLSIFILTAISGLGPSMAQMRFDPCFGLRPNDEVARTFPPCGDSDATTASEIEIQADILRDPSPAAEGQRCKYMTRQEFRPPGDDPEAYREFASQIEFEGFRHSRLADGRVHVFIPVLFNGPSAWDIALGQAASLLPGYVYVGWEYIPVSGCR